LEGHRTKKYGTGTKWLRSVTEQAEPDIALRRESATVKWAAAADKVNHCLLSDCLTGDNQMKWRPPTSFFCYKTSDVTVRKNKLSIFRFCELLASVPVWLHNNSSTARTVFLITENSGTIQTSRLCNDEQQLWEQHERPTSSYLLWVELEFNGHFTEEATNSCNQKGGWGGGNNPWAPAWCLELIRRRVDFAMLQATLTPRGLAPPPLPFHSTILYLLRTGNR